MELVRIVQALAEPVQGREQVHQSDCALAQGRVVRPRGGPTQPTLQAARYRRRCRLPAAGPICVTFVNQALALHGLCPRTQAVVVTENGEEQRSPSGRYRSDL